MAISLRFACGVFALAAAMAPPQATATNTLVSHSISTGGLTVPRGSVALIGIDRSDLGSLSLPGTTAGSVHTDGAVLEPIIGVTASNDLAVSLSIASPLTNEPMAMPLAQWTFKVSFSWGETSNGMQTVLSSTTGVASVTAKVGAKWTYTGGFGVEYKVAADVRSELQTNVANGLSRVSPVYFFNEQRFRMELERIPTGTKELEVHRIGYATSGGKTRSLVAVVAGSIEQMTQHVHVADTNPKFRWDIGWFFPLAEPVLNRPGGSQAPQPGGQVAGPSVR